MSDNSLIALLVLAAVVPIAIGASRSGTEREGDKIDRCAVACERGGRRLGSWSASAGCICADADGLLDAGSP